MVLRAHVLALSVLNPWMLFGLLLAAIPLMIHLFYRRRYQEVQWAAVLFLGSAVKRNAQRNRLQQLLLLLLRTLAIIALVFGFARPLVSAKLVPIDNAGRKHNVLVIDASLSMRCREGEGTRFSRAIEVAKGIVTGSREGDTFQLLRMSGRTPDPVIGQPTQNRDEVIAALEALTCTANGGENLAAWVAAQRLLRAANSNGNTNVYVLSDFQVAEWRRESVEGPAAELQEIARSARLTLVDVTTSAAPNLSVSDIKVEHGFVTVNQLTTIRVVLQNGDSEPAERDVRLLIDDRVVASERVSVNAYTRLTIPFQHRFKTSGTHRVAVEIDADLLPDDNRTHHVLNVFDDVPILLVNGKPSARYMGKATDFLSLSLDPDPDTQSESPYRVRVVSEVELGAVEVADYAAVFLCNVRQFTTDEATRLRNYVYSGGSVVLCLGNLTDLQNYNARLFDAESLMPGVRLVATVGDAVNPRDVFEFDSTDLSHPLLSVYRGNPGHGLEQVLTFLYTKATVAESADSRVALRFGNGDPVLVESSVGAGTVCLVTVAGDDSRSSTWNTASGTYVTLINEITQFVVQGRQRDRAATVGLPWSRPIRVGTEDSVSANVGGSVQVASVTSRDGAEEVLIEEVTAPGLLSVSVADQQFLVASNLNTAEADLRSLTESELREQILSECDFLFSKASEFQLAAEVANSGTENEAASVLFSLVALLVLAEFLLASRVGAPYWVVSVAVVSAVGLVLLWTR